MPGKRGGGGNQRFLRAHERFLLKKIVFRGEGDYVNKKSNVKDNHG